MNRTCATLRSATGAWYVVVGRARAPGADQSSALVGRDPADAESALKAAVVEVVLEYGVDRATTVFDEVVAAIRSVELA